MQLFFKVNLVLVLAHESQNHRITRVGSNPQRLLSLAPGSTQEHSEIKPYV